MAKVTSKQSKKKTPKEKFPDTTVTLAVRVKVPFDTWEVEITED